jgi:hypothetical protein
VLFSLSPSPLSFCPPPRLRSQGRL